MINDLNSVWCGFEGDPLMRMRMKKITVSPVSGYTAYKVRSLKTNTVQMTGFQTDAHTRETKVTVKFRFGLPEGAPLPQYDDVITECDGVQWSVISVATGINNEVQVIAERKENNMLGSDRLIEG